MGTGRRTVWIRTRFHRVSALFSANNNVIMYHSNREKQVRRRRKFVISFNTETRFESVRRGGVPRRMIRRSGRILTFDLTKKACPAVFDRTCLNNAREDRFGKNAYWLSSRSLSSVFWAASSFSFRSITSCALLSRLTLVVSTSFMSLFLTAAFRLPEFARKPHGVSTLT